MIHSVHPLLFNNCFVDSRMVVPVCANHQRLRWIVFKLVPSWLILSHSHIHTATTSDVYVRIPQLRGIPLGLFEAQIFCHVGRLVSFHELICFLDQELNRSSVLFSMNCFVSVNLTHSRKESQDNASKDQHGKRKLNTSKGD